jgi:hypothetical protein
VRNTQLQIRVTAAEKAALRRRARASGVTVSAFVLARALPAPGLRLEALLPLLPDPGRRGFAFAAIADLLVELPAGEFRAALEGLRLDGLGEEDRNWVAAMVEHAAFRKGVAPPAWTLAVAPPERPVFASPAPALRAHLLAASPAAYRRRNLFVNAGVGDRV